MNISRCNISNESRSWSFALQPPAYPPFRMKKLFLLLCLLLTVGLTVEAQILRPVKWNFGAKPTGGANAKDGVESRLNRAVCSGEVTLAAAQAAVATRWDTAETVLGVAP